MANQRERTSANETAYAEKHRILQALDALASDDWAQFKQVRRAYKQFRRKGKRGDRYDRANLLQDCEDKGLIEKGEHDLIKGRWDPAVDAILTGMDKALHSVRKGDELSCWIMYGGSHSGDRVVYRRRKGKVDLLILTERKPRKGHGPFKGKGRDPGFLDRLKSHHDEIGALLDGRPRR